MKALIVRLETGEYLTSVQLTSSYMSYTCTTDPAAADRFNDYDAQLVIKRLRKEGKSATREDAGEM